MLRILVPNEKEAVHLEECASYPEEQEPSAWPAVRKRGKEALQRYVLTLLEFIRSSRRTKRQKGE